MAHSDDEHSMDPGEINYLSVCDYPLLGYLSLSPNVPSQSDAHFAYVCQHDLASHALCREDIDCTCILENVYLVSDQTAT